LGGHAEVFDAEMAAIAIAAAKAKLLTNDFPNITHIEIFTDNAAAVLAVKEPKPSPAQIFALKFHKVIQEILESNENISITVSWCPSHCDIPGNDRADELAKDATKLGRQVPYSVSYSNANRRAKRAVAKMWQQEWEATPKEGHFAIANRIKPSLKPTKQFLNLKDRREVFGRVVQCRTGHAYTGEFRRSFLPLSADPTACPCDNATLESRNHILRDCPRYEQHRDILREASRSVALSTILGTVEGIAALAKFIAKSGAFSRTGLVIPTPSAPRQDPDADPNVIDPRWTQDDGG
jgi:hypothetical protein